ncbi:SWIM zinc finger family protein [Nocardioides mangrovi]|uniref:SWIM zinc finger family protein n=1 Tax=Nocardioides mangrovi TaxID=2874580 RepID=A0ABS7UER9_9ACTN|nr:SWIM zinc finger family protein [Nocardioides mangrovi]MBZ5739310.1 SWIM zinc finger family protein [Nocardioides mangrovi]
MAGPVLHPRVAARRGGSRATTWWGKAWVRAVEEAAYADGDLSAARSLARGGHVGGITTEPGRYVASVEDPRGLWTVEGTVPVLDESGLAALVETVAAVSGRIAALTAGDLPHDLVEQAEESGAELLPYGGELDASCGCDHWADPCVHALAVLSQLAWLVDADPFVLLQLRGMPREELLARLHARTRVVDEQDVDDVDLDLAVEAALYAARVLDEPVTEAHPASSG